MTIIKNNDYCIRNVRSNDTYEYIDDDVIP